MPGQPPEVSEEVARRLAKIAQEARRREGFRPVREAVRERDRGARIAAHFLYLLYLVPAHTFLLGPIVAHVMSATHRDSWVASHFRWLAVTFWVGLLGLLGVLAIFLLLWSTSMLAAAANFDIRRLLGEKTLFPVTITGGLLLAWYLYRLGRGWLLLCLGREIE